MSRSVRPSPSAAAWRRSALDRTVEACRLAVALRAHARPPADRGVQDALAWLREKHPGPLVDLASHLDDAEVLAALEDAELPPPWSEPPAALLGRLDDLEQRARVALRHYALVSAAPLTVREDPGPRWPAAAQTPAKAPTARPSRRSPLAALQEQARRRVAELRSLDEPRDAPSGAAVDALPHAPRAPLAVLHLEARGGLRWTLDRVPGLPPDLPCITLHAGASRFPLLASNVRTGPTSLPVPPSTGGYRLDPPVAPPLPGVSPAAASVFRVRADGRAERVEKPTLLEGQTFRLLVPPSLAHVALPDGAWSLPGGFRALEMRLAPGDAPGQAVLLAALGLDPGPRRVSLSWYGAAPARYRRTGTGPPLPVFAARGEILIRLRGRGPGCLVLTSEQGSVVVDVTEDGQIVALDDLEPGPYSLDLRADDPLVEPANRSFFVEDAAPPLPLAQARARWGSREISLHDRPTLGGALRGDGAITLTLPPFWPLGIRWEASRSQRLGSIRADGQGRVDLSALLASLARRLEGAPVADLVLDAGELGGLTLRHERPYSPDAVLEALVALLRERGALLAAGAPDVLRVAWVEPVCRALGYETSGLQQASPDDPWYQVLRTLTRCAEADAPLPFERSCYAVLFVTREPLAAGVMQRALRNAPAPRGIWTDGRRFRLIEQGRRLPGEPLDLDLVSDHAARVSLGRLVARLGA